MRLVLSCLLVAIALVGMCILGEILLPPVNALGIFVIVAVLAITAAVVLRHKLRGTSLAAAASLYDRIDNWRERIDDWLIERWRNASRVQKTTDTQHPAGAQAEILCVSDTKEIQLVFQREMTLLFNEVGCQPPAFVPGVITGKELGKRFKRFDRQWEKLGLKPEQVRVLLSLTFLLEHCAHLEATPQELNLAQAFFHPGKPTTPLVADAYNEVIEAYVSSTAIADATHLPCTVRMKEGVC